MTKIMDESYRISTDIPTVDDYCRLRRVAGLTPRTAKAAAAGLPNSVLAITVIHKETAIAMGRVIGDGGLFFQIVDIAVDPVHQGRGIGKKIMEHLTTQLRETVPAEAYVSLIADGEAHALYSQYGFIPTAPKSIGMALWIPDAHIPGKYKN